MWLGSVELLTQKVERLNEILPSITGMEGVLHMENWTEESANIIFQKVEESLEDLESEEEGEPQDTEEESSEKVEETPNDEDDAQN